MSTPTETVYVNILDKEYQVACPPRERDALLQSARELDQRMRAIKTGGSVIGLERIAVMAALNLCHELLALKRDLGHRELDDNLLQRLSDKLDQALEHLS
ncbi:cell division protein ZapA [Exilibacterium tricleocarpae]|uniref:Cell division protein ZapA n=1 Tax=Exilibacterium tricleocarpae TaxID=2591008 RepID=A0A545SXK6_9GAMM|nr:cell division protein ZapA [Exilibacterium tricleocarpae]TQV69696.1 cell division protein ZapA [Exilibacterium tricleocarpae]